MQMQLHEDAPRLVVPDRAEATARMKIDRAGWAVRSYARFDRAAVMRITRAVAEAAHQAAQEYAEWAVRETGMGVVAHKKQKNELSAHPLVDFYENTDLVNPRVDTERKMVELPKPAGVIRRVLPAPARCCAGRWTSSRTWWCATALARWRPPAGASATSCWSCWPLGTRC